MFKEFKEVVENEIDLNIKCLRSGHGEEFMSKEFEFLCEEKVKRRQYSTARTPQQNGVVERKNITITDMAKTMLSDSKISDRLWSQEVSNVVHIQNIGLLRTYISLNLEIYSESRMQR